jgi:hypothetical protein
VREGVLDDSEVKAPAEDRDEEEKVGGNPVAHRVCSLWERAVALPVLKRVMKYALPLGVLSNGKGSGWQETVVYVAVSSELAMIGGLIFPLRRMGEGKPD